MRTGIATNKKRMWPFQIDRIWILRVAQVANLRSLGARTVAQVSSLRYSLDTNAGLAPALEPSNPARPRLYPRRGEGIMSHLAHQVKTIISSSFPRSKCP